MPREQHDSQRSATGPRADWIARTPRWLLLAVLWIAQGFVIYAGQALLYSIAEGVDGPSGNLIGVWDPGRWAELMFGMPDYQWPTLTAIAVLTLAQWVFVMPVRKPGVSGGHGTSLRRSLVVAGLMIGGLFGAVVWAVVSLIDAYAVAPAVADAFMAPPWWVVGPALILTGWVFATPLLIVFSGKGPREGVLARLAQRLLLGTIVEVALLIPLDVMVRRKTSCYCWEGTYWALTVCGFVGIFALGPAVFLPLLAKRRASFYGGVCGVCGYDMRGVPHADRCPECGTGWKTSGRAKALVAASAGATEDAANGKGEPSNTRF